MNLRFKKLATWCTNVIQFMIIIITIEVRCIVKYGVIIKGYGVAWLAPSGGKWCNAYEYYSLLPVFEGKTSDDVRISARMLEFTLVTINETIFFFRIWENFSLKYWNINEVGHLPECQNSAYGIRLKSVWKGDFWDNRGLTDIADCFSGWIIADDRSENPPLVVLFLIFFYVFFCAHFSNGRAWRVLMGKRPTGSGCKLTLWRSVSFASSKKQRFFFILFFFPTIFNSFNICKIGIELKTILLCFYRG